ncbi:hypothetical protein GUJ93_ZPchr0006g44196 [Zizania palustris]|uniref:F-box domain-containing protein n=1 Tax=Zizania palustris TaxID=103762 RepID=A0A8J5TFC1_ZIZPA|nr:hypothetical protein GUJ93_ZPchr0006g44196 [Zizania palustris]
MADALESDRGSGVKRRRTDGQDGEGEPEEEDLISLLPDDMLREIVSRLPLRYGIRTQVVCKRWRNCWKERRQKMSCKYEILPRVHPSPSAVVEEMQDLARQRRLIEYLSVVIHTTTVQIEQFRVILRCTADCAVENLHIDLSNRSPTRPLRLHFPLLSRNLARLSLCATTMSNLYFMDARPFPELAAIYLHSVTVSTRIFDIILALCPSLRVLDLRKCSRLDAIAITSRGPNLTSLTIADCDGVTMVNVLLVSSLRSICYSGRFLPSPFNLPPASCTNLYLSYQYSGLILPKLFDQWVENTAVYLSNETIAINITNFTICSNALRTINFSKDHRESSRIHKSVNLPRLTELRLLMFEMKAENLSSIYLFLKIFRCPNLSRLFVQFPKFGHEPFQENLLDRVTEEWLEDGLDNLTVVRIMNFNWHRIKVQLLIFLLRNARNIRTLQLVSPSAVPLNVSGIEQEDLSPIREAFANDIIILRQFEDGSSSTKPFHSEMSP